MKSFCLSSFLVVAFVVMTCVGCTRSGTSPQIAQNQLAYQDEQPRVSGAWVGTWGISGKDAQGMQQRLDCRVVSLGAGNWEATFEGECGRPYKYTIQMHGRRAGDVVLFNGSADLGEKDGGVYDWIGRATKDQFVGFYTSQKYTGTFQMARTQESSGAVSEKP